MFSLLCDQYLILNWTRMQHEKTLHPLYLKCYLVFCKKGSLTKKTLTVVDPELKAEQHILNQFPCVLKSISFKLITKQL